MFELLRQKALSYGAHKVWQVDPNNLVFDERALLQCYNCENYGVKKTCPPNMMDLNYKETAKKYKKALLVALSFKNTDCAQDELDNYANKLHKILLKLEKDAFEIGQVYSVAFTSGSCKLCKKCPKDFCSNPKQSRMPIEAIGVDVTATMKNLGLKLIFPPTDEIYQIGLLLVG